jgi:hypothetical protein
MSLAHRNPARAKLEDPFTTDFFKSMQRSLRESPTPGDFEEGVPGPEFSFRDTPADSLLGSILQGLKRQIRSPLEDKEWEKVAWLYDRVAARLGVPSASSYPRVRPE